MLLAVVALVAVVLLVDGPEQASPPPDRYAAAPRTEQERDQAVQEEEATSFLPDLRADLLAGNAQRLGDAAATPAARRELVALGRNLDRLRVADFGLRYVDESDAALDGAERERFGPDAWVADVRLTWRFRGVERRASALEVPVVLTWAGGEPAFVTARVVDGRRVPLWWQAGVAVRRTPTTVVLAVERERLRTLSRQAVAAVKTVCRTLPSWRGPLVVEAGGTAEQFQSASGLPASSARAIAAVTTTTDGSGDPGSSSHIYLNSPVFDPLGPQGQQIVVSHEAAHVALDAATTSVPMWLSEGLADYVALVDSEVPVEVLATQIRRLVRDQGAPADLPGRAELDGGNQDIGAWYEAAWLAAAVIAEEHGEGALLELYRVTEEDGHARRAFREVLGTTEAGFVAAWRGRLAALAG